MVSEKLITFIVKMKHYVVAYPRINESDYTMIQNIRKEHDHLYDNIKPHFTCVFGAEMSSESFVNEIKKQSSPAKPVHFSIRCAVVNKDAFSEMYFTFLVPDEGFSEFVKIHDNFYSDKLSGFLRWDIDYIPHIAIARSSDKMVCKKLADEWNESQRVIHGHISSFEIITFENRVLKTLMLIPLDN